MEPSGTGDPEHHAMDGEPHAGQQESVRVGTSLPNPPPPPVPVVVAPPQTTVASQGHHGQPQLQFQFQPQLQSHPPIMRPTPGAEPPTAGIVQPGFGSQQLQSQVQQQHQLPPRPTTMLGANVPAHAAPSMLPFPFPMIQDPVILAQLTGFDPKMLVTHPTMMVAAQQIFAQRVLQHQLMTGAGFGARPQVPYGGTMARPARPPFVSPQANLACHKPASDDKPKKKSRTTPGGARKEKGPKPKAKQDRPKPSPKKESDAAVPPSEEETSKSNLRPESGKKRKAEAGKPEQPALEPEPEPINRDDPGGRVVWAKVANYPWWPAKTLDPTKDRSFPLNADRPRPNAIPVRFFGTHDFGWLGSKRALEEWEEGKQKSRIEECDQSSFKEAVKEAEVYLEQKILPDAFYLSPKVESGRKKHAAARRRSSGAGGKKVTIMDPIQRKAMVFERKKQRLLDWGLMPPPHSPYRMLHGRIAWNQQLLDACAQCWDAEALEKVEDFTKNRREPRPFRGMRASKEARNDDTVPTDNNVVEAMDLDTFKPTETENKVESNTVENTNVEQKC